MGNLYSTKPQVEALETLLRKLPGLALARVGEHLGVDHTTVPTKLRERGIPTRDAHGRPRP